MISDYIHSRKWHTMPVSDCHVHNTRSHPIEESMQLYQNMRSYLNVDKMLILALEETSGLEDHTSNIQALYMKERLENTYAFASFSYKNMQLVNGEALLEQAKFYEAVGFDGIKMLEGKANIHEIMGCKLDGSVYEPFFAYAERRKFPILIHVTDTVASFMPDRLHVKEMLHMEIENVLKKHPSLNIVLAHFYFMSHDMDRLEYLFEHYENVKLDLALGGDFLIRFSENIDEWRDFFIRHRKRILFGTDCYNLYFEPTDDYEITNRYAPIRDFLEREDTYVAECYTRQLGKVIPLKSAALPEEVLADIYYKNLLSFAGEKPRVVNYKLATEYAEYLIDGYQKGKLHTRALKPLPDYFAADEKANMERGNDLAMENLEVIKKYFEMKV